MARSWESFDNYMRQKEDTVTKKPTAPKTEHSPLPWITGTHMKPYVRGADGKDLALNLTPGNAALIVRAVNSHEALVEAVEEWAYWIDTLPGGLEQLERWARKQDNWADMPIASKLRAALALAKRAGYNPSDMPKMPNFHSAGVF